jgi:predicted ABC-type transport system involved in lysophospholipase L1 biosynthesis ATPase subunit
MGRTTNRRQFLAQKLETLNEGEVCQVLDYISDLESQRSSTHRSRSVSLVWEDEVLSVLSEALENQRARQAFEWEAVRRKAEKRAAARVGAHL